jgi:3-methyl-2-oxobutanoate hydroxymethyltransferase
MIEQDAPATLPDLLKLRHAGRKIAMLTAYDASFAALAARGGVDAILVGDSLGMVVQGGRDTLAVTLDDVCYHTRAVARNASPVLVVADLPFGSYQSSPARAMRSAARLLASGAQMVKLEGGAAMAATVRFLTERGVPVCAHTGLTPQAVHQFGGYRVQGRGGESADAILGAALAFEQAGASFVFLECIPAALGARITAGLTRARTIGIGAGPDCDGQVLVGYDALGITSGKLPRFVRNFLDGAGSIEEAVSRYARAVKDGSFPAPEHCY